MPQGLPASSLFAKTAPGPVTPAATDKTVETETEALAAARAATPERFGTDTAPKILDRPQDAWINQTPAPAEPADQTAA